MSIERDDQRALELIKALVEIGPVAIAKRQHDGAYQVMVNGYPWAVDATLDASLIRAAGREAMDILEARAENADKQMRDMARVGTETREAVAALRAKLRQ